MIIMTETTFPLTMQKMDGEQARSDVCFIATSRLPESGLSLSMLFFKLLIDVPLFPSLKLM